MSLVIYLFKTQDNKHQHPTRTPTTFNSTTTNGIPTHNNNSSSSKSSSTTSSSTGSNNNGDSSIKSTHPSSFEHGYRRLDRPR